MVHFIVIRSNSKAGNIIFLWIGKIPKRRDNRNCREIFSSYSIDSSKNYSVYVHMYTCDCVIIIIYTYVYACQNIFIFPVFLAKTKYCTKHENVKRFVLILSLCTRRIFHHETFLMFL